MQGPCHRGAARVLPRSSSRGPGRNIIPLHHVLARRGATAAFRFSGESRFLPPDVLTIDGFQGSSRSLLSGGSSRSGVGQSSTGISTCRRQLPGARPKIVTVTKATSARLSSRYTTARLPSTWSRSSALARIFATVATIIPSSWARTAQIPVEQIQHAYLHFMLDPLPLRIESRLESKRALIAIAAAPRDFPRNIAMIFWRSPMNALSRASKFVSAVSRPAQLDSALSRGGPDRIHPRAPFRRPTAEI